MAGLWASYPARGFPVCQRTVRPHKFLIACPRTKKKAARVCPELLSVHSYKCCQISETNLWTGRGAEIIGRAIIQEHNFIACFHPEAKPANVKFHAGARIKHAVGIAINNAVDLVIDDAGRHRTAYAKVYKPAFEQTENADWAGRLDL